MASIAVAVLPWGDTVHASMKFSASTCVPDPGTECLYQHDYGMVTFQSGATGNINFTCNIPVLIDGCDCGTFALRVAYQDPDGSGGESHVTVRLHGVLDSADPPVSSSELVLVEEIDSEDVGKTVKTKEEVTFLHAFVPTASYHVRIGISRTVASRNPFVTTVELEAIDCGDPPLLCD